MGILDAMTLTAAWTIIFFVASAGASAAYLTIGESFPLEMRTLTTALFYAFGTASSIETCLIQKRTLHLVLESSRDSSTS